MASSFLVPAPFASSAPAHWYARLFRCSRRTAAAILCAFNIAAVLYILQLLAPIYLIPSSSSSSSTPSSLFSYSSASSSVILRRNNFPLTAMYTKAQLARIQESVEVWKHAEPVDLMKRVREIENEVRTKFLAEEELEFLRESLTIDLKNRLMELREATNDTKKQIQGLEKWRNQKLEKLKMDVKLRSGDNSFQEATAAGLRDLLISEWNLLLEEIGWMDSDDSLSQGEEIPSDQELEEAIIPGRTAPKECNAEAHTDYGGAAVRWGLTFHVESAADCCQACIDQAKAAKPNEMKCNIWVFCPEEAGCYSPDIYEHKHHECWLKQANQPRLNFKGKYVPEYRKSHPTAPIVVPWAAGVIKS